MWWWLPPRPPSQPLPSRPSYSRPNRAQKNHRDDDSDAIVDHRTDCDYDDGTWAWLRCWPASNHGPDSATMLDASDDDSDTVASAAVAAAALPNIDENDDDHDDCDCDYDDSIDRLDCRHNSWSFDDCSAEWHSTHCPGTLEPPSGRSYRSMIGCFHTWSADD